MIQLERLLADLRPPEPLVELETADPRLEEAGAAAIRGLYAKAAQIAEELYAAGIFDARLVGYLLYAALLERGPAALELLLRAVAKGVGDNRTAFTPVKRRDVLLDSSLSWFLGKLVRELERATQLRDEAWERWRSATKDGALAGALPVAEALQPVLGALLPRPRALVPLSHLIELLRQLKEWSAEPDSQRSTDTKPGTTFSSAATLEGKPQEDSAEAASDDDPGDAAGSAQPAEATAQPDERAADPAGDEASRDERPDPAGDGGPEDDAEPPRSGPSAHYGHYDATAVRAAGPELRAPGPPGRLPAGFVTKSAILASAPLRQLAHQIQRFEALTEQAEYLHAAVMADELQRAIDSFDPRVYLPALLAPYFRTLARYSSELTPMLGEREGLAFRALRQLYQVDPEAFLAEMNSPARPGGSKVADRADDLDSQDPP